MEITALFDTAIQYKASDLHIMAGVQPTLRIDGVLTGINNTKPLTKKESEELVFSILSAQQKESFVANRFLDFSYAYGGDFGDKGRFRVNAYFQKDSIAAAFRLLPSKVKTVEDLNLPQICHTFAKAKQGLVLVTGPTGHGKSTTIASLVNEINMTDPSNIITIEDPVEYIYPKGKSIISQREIGTDTHSWEESLRSILREDPDVVVIGEMRDTESIASAITIAETGHLVFSTLHTNSAAQTIDRIVDAFPEHQQNQIRMQLSGVLNGVISQRLVPKIDGGRTAVCEILVATSAVKANIREGKTHLLDSAIETSQNVGMIKLENALAELVRQGIITLEVGKQYATREDEFNRLVG